MKRTTLLFVVAFASVSYGAEIRTIGEKLEDDIVSIGTEGGRAVVRTAKGKTVALAEVKHIRFDDRAPSVASDATVILLDRDEIHGSVGAWADKGDSFKLKTASLGDVDVKIDGVAAIFFNATPDGERRLANKYLGWLQQPDLTGRPQSDAVYIRAGGKATGTITEISTKGIKLDAKEIGVQTFPLDKVEAIVCGNAGTSEKAGPAKGTIVRIRCADGTSVSGVVTKFDGARLDLDHVLGPLAIKAADMLELFVLNGAFVYLSDLGPEKVDEHFQEGFERDKELWGWKRDKQVLGDGPLRLGGRSYDKGLGVHSYCALTYKINGGFKEFRVVVGVDDSTKYWATNNPGAGSVTFRVLVGDEKKGMKPAREIPEGKKKKRGEPPEELTINVEGAETLTLIADYGNYMHILGRADWADAHLVKR